MKNADEYATLEWVDWFNNRRLLAPIDNITPAEAERYYAMWERTAMAAYLNQISSGNPGTIKNRLLKKCGENPIYFLSPGFKLVSVSG